MCVAIGSQHRRCWQQRRLESSIKKLKTFFFGIFCFHGFYVCRPDGVRHQDLERNVRTPRGNGPFPVLLCTLMVLPGPPCTSACAAIANYTHTPLALLRFCTVLLLSHATKYSASQCCLVPSLVHLGGEVGSMHGVASVVVRGCLPNRPFIAYHPRGGVEAVCLP